ncbi:MAG: N-acetyltransferase [Chloroflexota bacterium]|nr:N-acetyltransferase [Chloroflexota bacterium]
MDEDSITIRNEAPADESAVRHILLEAFDGDDEARIVELLCQAQKSIISLVAVYNGDLVGHILFSPMTIHPPQPDFNALGLAPLAVLPEYQGRGVGTRLTQEGLRICKRLGYSLVFVLGHPDYYSRFGFGPAGAYGLGSVYGAGDAFMVQALCDGALNGLHGTVKYPPEFN